MTDKLQQCQCIKTLVILRYYTPSFFHLNLLATSIKCKSYYCVTYSNNASFNDGKSKSIKFITKYLMRGWAYF